MAPTSNRTGPIIILGLLVTSLCLSVGAIALIIFFNQNRPTSEELTVACKDQVGGAITAEYDRVVKMCQEEITKNAVKRIPAANDTPGFDIPSSWTVIGRDISGEFPSEHWLDAAPGVMIQYCEGCDGPYIPIHATSFEKTADTKFAAAATPKAYVEARYAASEFLTNITVTEEKLKGFDVIKVTGHQSGLYEIDFEDIYYVSNRFIVRIRGDQSSEYGAAWEMVKTSLDLSKIE